MLVKPTPSVSTTRVAIRVGASRYDALIGSGLLALTGELTRELVRGPACALIADENTAGRFARVVEQSLAGAEFQPTLITIPAGEISKSLRQLGVVCERMAAAGLDRTSFVVALGGGVVGDLAGFAAAVFHRGIPYVQVPTTLLAQVDSSIGGKTAVNIQAGKNLLGTIHQPMLVLADTEALQTLPARELNQGFAEVIKHAVIADISLFEALEQFDRGNFAQLIARNIAIKARIIARDEQDVFGERAILNFGHTVGHAIEQVAGFGPLLHGEAVSLGIVAACEISVRKAGLSEAERQTVLRLLRRFDLPTRLPNNFPREQIPAAVRADKKFERGEVRFVVTPALGSARLTSDVTLEEIARAVQQL